MWKTWLQGAMASWSSRAACPSAAAGGSCRTAISGSSQRTEPPGPSCRSRRWRPRTWLCPPRFPWLRGSAPRTLPESPRPLRQAVWSRFRFSYSIVNGKDHWNGHKPTDRGSRSRMSHILCRFASYQIQVLKCSGYNQRIWYKRENPTPINLPVQEIWIYKRIGTTTY